MIYYLQTFCNIQKIITLSIRSFYNGSLLNLVSLIQKKIQVLADKMVIRTNSMF